MYSGDYVSDAVGLVMVQRNEGWLLGLNVAHHLSMGVSRIVIVDNQSDDTTTVALLSRLASHPRITVIFDSSTECNQAALANQGLALLIADKEIEWVFPCDADEFVWCRPSLRSFLSRCKHEGIMYGTLPWLNHLPEHTGEGREPLAYVRGGWFYTPFAEMDWQHPGHFRKAFCARHEGMEVVVGGHYFRREANAQFFDGLAPCPNNLPATAGVIVHFELRDCGSALIRKLRDLSSRHVSSGVPANGPWREKEMMMGKLWREYRDNADRLFLDFAGRRRTLWGGSIPPFELVRRDDINSSLGAFLSHIPCSPTEDCNSAVAVADF